MEIKDQDLSKAFKILDALQVGGVMDLNRIPEERRELFVACAKKYIDSVKAGEFNNDYTKFKKIEKWNKIK